jgi:hypothetical protein
MAIARSSAKQKFILSFFCAEEAMKSFLEPLNEHQRLFKVWQKKSS